MMIKMKMILSLLNNDDGDDHDGDDGDDDAFDEGASIIRG